MSFNQCHRTCNGRFIVNRWSEKVIREAQLTFYKLDRSLARVKFVERGELHGLFV